MTTKWLQSMMPKNLYTKAKSMLVFRPEDPINLWQATPRFETGSKVERIVGYRYPAPGSAHLSRVPVRDSEDAVYNITNYPRNPNNIELDQETMIASTEPVLSNPPSQWGDRNGSDGRFANPAVKKYDPSGLRSSMSATWGELDKALAEQAQADHLPSNNGENWQAKQEALDAESERKGIPYVSGSNYRGYTNRPKNYTDCRW